MTKRILLIISGGIAAYKCLELIRRLREGAFDVSVILTEAAKKFVTPLSVTALAGEAVYDDLFDLAQEAEIGHIQLSRNADLLVVAPASADLMAKMANGFADDLASTTLLATDKQILIAPAMNVRMWQHPATRRNLAQLKADGVLTVGPNEGDMACGEFGPGRMAEPAEIVAAIQQSLKPASDGPLSGKTVLITAGPTHEPIDPVRYIANRSSGRQGYAIARAAVALGARTILVSGPSREEIPPGVEMLPVETAVEMLNACQAELPVDIAVCAAAVADWRLDKVAENKLKKSANEDELTLSLRQNPDILKAIASAGAKRPKLVVGFAAETNSVEQFAREKLQRKGCDMIIANDVSADNGVMGGNDNTVHIVTQDKTVAWPKMAKQQVADKLMALFADKLSNG